MKLTLESQNPKLLELIEELARHLGISIKKSPVNKTTAENKEGLSKEMRDNAQHLQGRTNEEKKYQAPHNTRRALMALEKLAEYGAFKDIDDPAEWQREIRKDKPLTGRDD